MFYKPVSLLASVNVVLAPRPQADLWWVLVGSSQSQPPQFG